MFNAYKNLIGKRFEEVDNNKLFILNRWASFNPLNYEVCSDVDKLNLVCKNKDMLKFLLNKKINRRIPKFLKAEKYDKEILDYVKKYYGWSIRELSHQLKFIDLEDKDFLKTLSIKFGWDKKTCKKYGIKFKVPKKEKLKKEEKKENKEFV
jgi:hypothetical protein